VTSTPRRLAAAALSAAALAIPLAGIATTADAAPSYHYRNCTELHKDFKHGVGKKGAKDKTSGTRVTTFKVSTTIYNKAFAYHKDLDRDRDGIACEKR
jgi:uncharacterized membrane protein